MPPLVREVIAGGAAARAGVQDKDLVVSINQQPVHDALQLQSVIGSDLSGKPQAWQVNRAGQMVALQVTPNLEQANGKQIARVGIYFGDAPATVLVRYGLLDGLKRFRHRLLHDSADLAQIGLHEFILLIPREHRGGIGPTTRRQLDFAQRRAEAGQRHLTSGFGSYAGEPL